MNRDYKKDFPIFAKRDMAYLDNGATTQRPASVIEAEKKFYETYNANPLRGLYELAGDATQMYEDAREKVRAFIGARSTKEIIFTRNATEAINLVAYSYGLTNLTSQDEILVSVSAHHSNLLPWQMVARNTGAKLIFMECESDGSYDPDKIKALINSRTKLAALEIVSNVTGAHHQVELVTRLVHEVGGVVLLDGAQSVPHEPTNVVEMDADFLVFSGHKMLASFGIGVLYGKESLLKQMPPFLSGGEMIEYVQRESATYAPLPHKFEAGTVNAGGAVSLGAAIDYISEIGFEEIMERERALTKLAFDEMKKIPWIHIIGADRAEGHEGILAFTVDGVHPHDIASILDEDHVYVRAGHHCAQPLLKHLGIASSARLSLCFYNTQEDVRRFIDSISRVRGLMGFKD